MFSNVQGILQRGQHGIFPPWSVVSAGREDVRKREEVQDFSWLCSITFPNIVPQNG